MVPKSLWLTPAKLLNTEVVAESQRDNWWRGFSDFGRSGVTGVGHEGCPLSKCKLIANLNLPAESILRFCPALRECGDGDRHGIGLTGLVRRSLSRGKAQAGSVLLAQESLSVAKSVGRRLPRSGLLARVDSGVTTNTRDRERSIAIDEQPAPKSGCRGPYGTPVNTRPQRIGDSDP